MKNKKFLLFVLFFFIGILKIDAAYINNQVSKYTNPDGKEITVYITGDEYFRYTHDKQKNVLIKNDSGYYTYATIKDGKVVSTNFIYDMKNVPTNTIKVGDIDLKKNENLVHNFDNQTTPKSSFISSKKRSQREGSIEDVLNYNSTVVFIRFKNESEFVNTSFINSLREVLGSTNSDSTGLKSFVNKVTEGHVNANSNILQINNNNYYSYVSSHTRGYLQEYSSSNPDGYTAGTSEGDQRLLTILNDAVRSLPTTATSNVDANGDGLIDNIIFIASGYPDGWSDPLWPHKWDLRAYGSNQTFSGATVSTYNLQFAETGDMSSKVSVFCHETMHSLGLPDLYRYSYNGDPVGPWDMMNIDQEGSYVTTHIRNRHGYTKNGTDTWSVEPTVISQSGKYELNLASTNSGVRSYRINTTNTNQFLQLEYRGTSGDVYDSNLPYNGLLISRVNLNYEGNEGDDSSTEDEYYIYRPNETTTLGGFGDLYSAAVEPCNGLISCSNKRGIITSSGSITAGALTLENGTNTRTVIKNVEYAGTNKIKFDVFVNGDVAYLENAQYTGAIGESYNVNPVFEGTTYTPSCSSSNSSIASVNSSCVVTLTGVGQATITVTINGKNYYSYVEVLPSLVENLTATLNNAERITLTYTLSGNPVEAFLIYRSVDGVNFSLLSETTNTQYVDNNFEFGNTYYYKVGIRYEGQIYTDNYIVSVNTLDYLPPKVTINSTYINGLNSGTISYTLSSGAEGYRILVSDNPIGPFEEYTTTVNTTYNFNNLDVAKNYYIKVAPYKVTNGNKYEAEHSNMVLLNTREKLLVAPKITNVQAISNSEVQITYTSNSNATGYNIYVSTNNKDFELLKEDNKDTYYVHENVEFGKTYYYKVSAILDNTYEGYRSNTAKITVNQVTPQNFKVKSNGFDSILVSYDSIPNATGYEIYYSQDNKTFKKLVTTNKTIYTHSKLKFNTKYYYKVRSYRVVGDKTIYSNYSSVLNAKPLSQAPKLTITQLDNGVIKLKYSSDSSANNYKIYLQKDGSSYELLTTTKKTEYTIKNLSLGETVNIKVVSYKDKVKGNETILEYTISLKSPNISLNTSTNTITIDGVKDAVFYDIYKCSSTCELIASTDELTYTSSEINNSDIYAYYVIAYNQYYNSNISNIVSNGSLYNINSFKAVSSNSNEVKINVNTTTVFDGYELHMSSKKDTGYKKVTDSKNIEFKYNKVELDKTYYFKVKPYRTINGKKVYGILSSVVTYKHTLNKIDSIKLTNNSSNSVKITFDKVKDAKGYYLYYNDGVNGYKKLATLKTNSYTHKNLTTGTTAYYKVKSYMVVKGKTITSAFGKEASIVVKSASPKYTITSLTHTSVRIDITGEGNQFVVKYGTSENNLSQSVNVTGSSVVISNLDFNQTYYFKVSERRNGVTGEGEIKSHTLKVVVPNASSVINGRSSATLNWNYIGDNVYYEVYLQNVKIYDGQRTTLEQENLVTGKEYTYKIRSYIVINEEKVYSDFKVISVRCLPDPINSFVASVNTNLDTLTVDFNPVDGEVAYYKLLYTNKLDSAYKEMGTTTTNRFSNISVSAGKTYYLKVVAVSLYNNQEYYREDSNYIVVKIVPKTVSSITFKHVTFDSLKINWSKVSGVNGYELYYSTKSNKGFKKVTTTTATNYTQKKLKVNTKYYYKIRTFKTINGKKYYSNYSDVFSGKPLPAAPTNVKATRYQQSATKNTVTWNKVSSVTGYYVYRSTDGVNYTKIGSTTSTKYIDKSAYAYGTYYKVKAYKTVSGKKYAGDFSEEFYMRAPKTPSFSIVNTEKTNQNTYYKVMGFTNNGTSKVTILSKGAYSIDDDTDIYDRNMYLVNSDTAARISKLDIKAGEYKIVAFEYKTSTWYDKYTRSYFYMVYDGVKYLIVTSYYYGTYYAFAD